jgi:L-amino acid N-acyltransferase YncA
VHSGPALTLRPATPDDIPAITAIYGPNVRDGVASFEYEPPDEAEMARRQAAILSAGYPYLVAELNGAVAGYAYASAYRTRPGYRFVVENSVYVSPAAQGKGVGRALLDRLIDECTAKGYRQMIAVIGNLGNAGSIALHRACGFTVVGVLPSIGWKLGRWVDSVLMQRPLGEGDRIGVE